jgi:Polyketide cyclase / dehydrase and lipid transport
MIIKKILAGVAVLFAIVLIYGAFKPGHFRVQRAIAINASPDKIFPLINDFHNWPSWSPWEKLDPNMKRTLTGPPSGTGAAYEWDGNNKAGKGRMEITESVPSSKLGIKLDFIRPMEGSDQVEFTLRPNGNSTDVTWEMSGPLTYPGRVMTIFVSMDSLIGKDFDTGLANLKTVAEKQDH